MPLPATVRTGRSTWLLWLVGIALLVAVVLVALHASEAGAYVHVLAEARPGWLALGLSLQAATYLAQGLIWRAVVDAGGMRLSVGAAYRLSLVKLLVDQALPSSGLSGSVVVANALQGRGVRKDVTTAGIVIGAVGYLIAYSMALLAGLGLLAHRHAVPASALIVAAGALAATAVLGLAVAFTAWQAVGTGSRRHRLLRWLGHWPHLLDHIDAGLARNPRLLGLSASLQACIIALDALTMWTLVRSLGTDAPMVAVFSSFMAASVLRTISVVPGGLGAFEAASVLSLHGAGLPVPISLVATLMFRALSFWLPMLPGAWLARDLLHDTLRSGLPGTARGGE